MSQYPIRVVVVDDHPSLRAGIRSIIALDERLVVLGEAASGEEAVRVVAECQPDVVTMDLRMPKDAAGEAGSTAMGGLETTAAIRQVSPQTRVLIFTTYGEEDLVASALRQGAGGYLLKDSGGEELRRAILTVAEGSMMFGPEVAPQVSQLVVGSAAGRSNVPFPNLTDRERAVLDLMARGLNNAEVARQLFLSDKTVRNYITNIFRELGVTESDPAGASGHSARVQAVLKAKEAGLGQVSGLRPPES